MGRWESPFQIKQNVTDQNSAHQAFGLSAFEARRTCGPFDSTDFAPPRYQGLIHDPSHKPIFGAAFGEAF
ncbi:MAG TPA: hypothetical protein DCL32_09055 [Gammaproteobacteria bacterium]|jgi:hypothetical protein|nr:hypothetical protein [Gammaproteobacteria bacterium]